MLPGKEYCKLIAYAAIWQRIDNKAKAAVPKSVHKDVSSRSIFNVRKTCYNSIFLRKSREVPFNNRSRLGNVIVARRQQQAKTAQKRKPQ